LRIGYTQRERTFREGRRFGLVMTAARGRQRGREPVANGPFGDDLLDWVCIEFPLPIAQTARRFQAANEDARRLAEVHILGQTLIITLGTIALAWCNHRFLYPDGVRRWYEKVDRGPLSLGDWLEAARGGAALAWETGTPLAGLEFALGREDSRLLAELRAVVNLRNRFVHGVGTTMRVAELADYPMHLGRALQEAAFLSKAQFVLVERSDRQRGGGYRIEVWKVTGDNHILRRRPAFSSPEALYSRALYLLQEQGDDLDLTPFWLAREDEAVNGWEIFYLDKKAGDRYEYRSFLRPGDSVPETELPAAPDWSDHGPGAAQRFRQAPTPASLRGAYSRPLPLERIDLARLHERTLASMLEKMSVDEATGDKGWNANLDLRPITAVATAIGLRIVRLAARDLSVFGSADILDTLWRRQVDGGCWSSLSQLQTPRPEATSIVLLAFCDEGDWGRARSMRQRFERLLEPHRDTELWGHVWSMTLALSTLCVLEPGSDVLAHLVEGLEEATVRDTRGRIVGWTRFTRLHPDFDERSDPSAAHTAKVLLALRHCRAATGGRLGTPPGELATAVQWLLREARWDNVDETIERSMGGGRSEKLLTRHFTSPWVLQALLAFDVDPGNERIGAAIGELYEQQEDGLWDWSLPGGPTIRRPVWATMDALRALAAYTQRAARNPGSTARR
jgi:hypothetical protein